MEQFLTIASAVTFFAFVTFVIVMVISELIKAHRRKEASECLHSFYFQSYYNLEQFLLAVGILKKANPFDSDSEEILIGELSFKKFSIKSLAEVINSVIWNHENVFSEYCFAIAKIIYDWPTNKRKAFLEEIENSDRHDDGFSKEVRKTLELKINEIKSEGVSMKQQRKMSRVVRWYSRK